MDFGVIRKKFEMNIDIKRRYRTTNIKVEYEQATMYDVMEFIFESSKDWFNVVKWIVEFVEANTKKKLKKRDRIMIAIKNNEIFQSIQDTYFEWAFSESKNWNTTISESNDLVSSYISFLSSELKQDPLYLMKNYTIEQLRFFTDWVIWNLNEKTEEWRKKNRLKEIWRNNDKLDKSAVQSLLQQLEKKKCNEQLEST